MRSSPCRASSSRRCSSTNGSRPRRCASGNSRPGAPGASCPGSWWSCSLWRSTPRSWCQKGTYPSLRADGIATLFYFANWHFIAVGSNYFDQTSLVSPLSHTWSLAVEEQFYLVWPLIVLFVFKWWKSKSVLLIVCLTGAVASAVEMAVLYSLSEVNRVY